jgi:hypothetical protein
MARDKLTVEAASKEDILVRDRQAFKASLSKLVSLDPAQWYHARLALPALKLNGETIAVLMMGPHGTC